MMIDPRTQPRIADGPAMVAAVSAPNNQPDPMIEVSEAHNRPRNPTPRSRPSLSSPVFGAAGVASSVIQPSPGMIRNEARRASYTRRAPIPNISQNNPPQGAGCP